MTLVMDGVRGALPARPLQESVRPKAPAKQPVPDGMQMRIGLDGIRRSSPTPRDVLASLGAVSAVEPMVAALPAPAGPVRLRPTAGIAFGLVATALLTAGVATASHALPTTTPVAAAPQARAAAPAVSSAAAVTPAAVASTTPADTGLQALLSSFAAGQPNVYSVVVKNLSTGETATINGDQVSESASMYKLFVAQTVYQQMDLGKLAPGTVVPGTGNNVAGCLKFMITVSDNTCGRGLRALVGLETNNAAIAAENYGHTDITGDYPQTSASDIATLYERLYSNTLNSPSSNDAFLSLLKGQLVNNRLPAGLPTGTVIAHKTGDLDGYMHDGGIVYGPKGDYVVVVMGAPGANAGAFANLSQQLWQHFEQ